MRRLHPRTIKILAWGSATACVVLTVAGQVLTAVSAGPVDETLGNVLSLAIPLGLLAFPIVGAVIAARHPDNAIGWLFCATGLVFALGIGAESYLVHRPLLPGRPYAALVAFLTANSPAVFSFFTFFLLLFPDGRLSNRPWRHLARVSVVTTTLFLIFIALKPGKVEVPGGIDYESPIALDFIAPIWKIVELPLVLPMMLCVPVAAVAFVLRFRRSRGVERQQLKWFALAAVIIGLVVGTGPVVFSVEALWWMWPIAFLIGTTSVPIAAGMAIMRYRLYDIDRIISRTMSYAIVTLLLAAAFGSVVLVPTTVIGSTGRTPDPLKALATLAVAGMFRPVRQRVQSVVDRRFNRSRYDAQRTVDEFAARLRQEIDLDTLGTELPALVSSTMAPQRVSLWLRPRGTRR